MAIHKIKELGNSQLVRSERISIAYGVIPAGSVADGDEVVFNNISGKIVSAVLATEDEKLDIFHSVDLSEPIEFTADGSKDISYTVTYIRGVGHIGVPGSRNSSNLLTIKVSAGAPTT